MRPVRRSGLLAGLLLILVPAGAQAIIVPINVKTYEASIDVDLEVTMKTFWRGIRPGCFAPAENFSMSYQLDLRTHRPNPSGAKPTMTAAIVSALDFGVAPTYGVRGSFRQTGSPGPWELQITNPAGCSTVPPLRPPPWAVSPSCNAISDRTVATLQEAGDDERRADPLGRDGSLQIERLSKIPLGIGAAVRPGCFRTLHDVTPVGLLSDISISPTSTRIEVPVPLLERKLSRLAAGSAEARPSFRVDIYVGGPCQAMTMRPLAGRVPDFKASDLSQANRPLGPNADGAGDTGCTIEAKGRAIVRREGPAQRTFFRPPSRYGARG